MSKANAKKSDIQIIPVLYVTYDDAGEERTADVRGEEWTTTGTPFRGIFGPVITRRNWHEEKIELRLIDGNPDKIRIVTDYGKENKGTHFIQWKDVAEIIYGGVLDWDSSLPGPLPESRNNSDD